MVGAVCAHKAAAWQHKFLSAVCEPDILCAVGTGDIVHDPFQPLVGHGL